MSQLPPPPTATMPSTAAPDPDAVTPFSKVPVEVLLRISSHLTTPELGNLRLTCKSIEQSMFNTFMREFFTKRQFMLTEDSLEALVDISKSRLSDCLDHVIIGLNYFENRYFPPGNAAKENAYRKAYADHRTLVSSGQDVAMLTEAFQNLKNLKTVGIRDYHSRERAGRDGYGATWASYGATTIFKETGIDLMSPMHSEHAQEYANKVMVTLFTALGNAGARPSTFEMLRRQQRVPNDDGFNLFTKYLKPKVLPVLEGIKTLILVVNASTGPTRAVSVPGMPTQRDGDCYDYLLRQFLGYMTNLKHLRLNFYNGRGSAEKLLNWLAAPALKAPSSPHPANTALLAPPPPPVFPYLRELNLGFCDLNHKGLVQVVRKFAPTLKSLELYRVTLVNQPVHTNGVDQSDQSARYKVNLWSKMLKSLCEIPGLDLEHIMIGLPNQRSYKASSPFMVANSRVWFHPKDAPDEKLTMESYTGIDWKHYVGALTNRIKMDSPPETDDEEEDEDEDDEMFDSEADEDEDEDEDDDES